MSDGDAQGSIVAVCSNQRHGFSKPVLQRITLLAGLGVEGDAHCGATVQHLYLKRKRPQAPNRMQVHLLQSELFQQLAHVGLDLSPGQLGENITTGGVDLLALPLGARLHLGGDALVELTGLRSPCKQIDQFMPGLLKHLAPRDSANRVAARAGVMAVVIRGGDVFAGCNIRVELPPLPHLPLQMI